MKYSKIFLPIFFSLLLFLFFLLALNDFNIFLFKKHFYKLLSSEKEVFFFIAYITAILILTNYLTIYLRKYINILFFSIIYLISSLSAISAYTYFELSKNQATHLQISGAYFFFLLISFLGFEFLTRSYNSKIAKNIFFGSRLSYFSKNPNSFTNPNDSSDFILIYFDIPNFYNVQEKIKIDDINKFFIKFDKILTKTLNDYNAVLVNKTQVSALYAIEKAKFNSLVYSDEVDYGYYGVLSAISIKNAFANRKISNFFLDELKPRFFISTNNARIIQKTSDKKLKFHLLSDSFKTIEKLKQHCTEDDAIIIDANTYNLISNYFSTKEILNNAYLVIGISAY